MRNRRKTIESLRRLAERPGTPSEGEVARKLLDKLMGGLPAPKPFNVADFPRGTLVYYNYWAYPINDPCVIVGKEPKTIQGQVWLRMKFNHLKQPRRVPVTSEIGCHISKTPLSREDSGYFYFMGNIPKFDFREDSTHAQPARVVAPTSRP